MTVPILPPAATLAAPTRVTAKTQHPAEYYGTRRENPRSFFLRRGPVNQDLTRVIEAASNKPLGMNRLGGVQDHLTVGEIPAALPLLDHGRRHQTEAGVVMFQVVPPSLAESARIPGGLPGCPMCSIPSSCCTAPTGNLRHGHHPPENDHRSGHAGDRQVARGRGDLKPRCQGDRDRG